MSSAIFASRCQLSLDPITAFMSITGVPSIASIGPIRIRLPSISRTVTRCKPSGFGLLGDRVKKTPVSGEF